MKEKETIIFTDGGAIGNPGPGGWGAIIVDENKKEVKEIGGKEDKTTNNRMEMMAIIEALKIADPESLITLYSDSKYTITGITQWIFGWEKNNWQTKNKTDVLNKDLWQVLAEVSRDKEIEWKHVAGHVGIAGNERVDVIANSFARGKSPELFSGSSSEYSVDIKNFSQDAKKVVKKSSGGKAFSYVSMVDGKIEKHTTWPECEARVKGKKARFKKALSKDDEEEIIKEWLALG